MKRDALFTKRIKVGVLLLRERNSTIHSSISIFLTDNLQKQNKNWVNFGNFSNQIYYHLLKDENKVF